MCNEASLRFSAQSVVAEFSRRLFRVKGSGMKVF